MSATKIDRKVLLMILDGWGLGDHKKDDAIFSAHPEYVNSLTARYPHAQLLTSGEDVGLPEGQMGNSEVGHLNIGAGRIVYQDLVKINRACRDGSIMQNPEIVRAFEYARDRGVKVHFMGLVSDGGVHSSLDHLFALCDIAKHYGIADRTFVHCFMDGRDTDPRSGRSYIEALQSHLKTSGGAIATVIGRYYAMDRDKRWERVRVAYDALVSGVGAVTSAPGDMAAAVGASYDEGVTDEFIKPIVGVGADGQPVGTIREGDMVIFFNFRNDRAKELTEVLTQNDMTAEGMHTVPLYYCTMTPYDANFRGLHILFDKENVENPIGEYISSLGLCQLRIAETEKYAHVTFFLNGGREAVFPGEERILVPSPKVATYDLQPEMSAPEVADKLVAAIGTGKFDFIALNFANGDMVGHTGVYEAIVKAVKTVDKCAGEVIDAAKANGYEVVVIADHGNADHALNPDGSPNTAHSLNPVPIIVVSDRVAAVADGTLADVAPTVLRLMGLSQPTEMTGRVLVEFK
jgi:2,3-bisphosphoglycerate-independent phosphoglycerate mutase